MGLPSAVPPPWAEPAASWPIVEARVGEALARGPVRSLALTIACRRVVLAAADDLDAQLLPTFAHLQSPIEGSAPWLRIEVAALAASDARGLRLDAVPASGVVHGSGSKVVHLQRHSAVVLDRDHRTVKGLLLRSDGGPSWQRAKPLQVPLSIVLADDGVDLLHGGLVSRNGQGLLLAGAAGAGKSTLAVAALLAGFDFLGDDCVGVRSLEDRFEGYSVFGSSCLEHGHLARFPLPAGLAVERGDDEKAVLPAATSLRGRLVPATTIRAVVLPRVTNGEHVALTPAPGREALLALAPGSILKRAVPARGTLARTARLARTLPAFRLEMGPLAETAPCLHALLDRL